jgi:hypothetical protein
MRVPLNESEAVVVGPNSAHGRHQELYPDDRQFRKNADLPPSVFERCQIVDAVLLYGRKQTFKPFLAHQLVGRRIEQQGDQFLQGRRHCSSKCARRGVYILKGRPPLRF